MLLNSHLFSKRDNIISEINKIFISKERSILKSKVCSIFYRKKNTELLKGCIKTYGPSSLEKQLLNF